MTEEEKGKSAGRPYRIRRDAFAGFEVQTRRFGIWYQWGGTNTHFSIEKAREYVDRMSHRVVEHGRA